MSTPMLSSAIQAGSCFAPLISSVVRFQTPTLPSASASASTLSPIPEHPYVDSSPQSPLSESTLEPTSTYAESSSPLVGLGIHGVSFESVIQIHHSPLSTTTTTSDAPIGLGIHGLTTTGLVGISSRMQPSGVSQTMLTQLEDVFASSGTTDESRGLGIAGVRTTGLVGINACDVSTSLSQTMLTQLEDEFASSSHSASQPTPCGLGITGVPTIGLVGLGANESGLSQTMLSQLEDEFAPVRSAPENIPSGLGIRGVSGNGVVGLNDSLSHTIIAQLEEVFTSPSFPAYSSALAPIGAVCGLGLMTNGVEVSDGTGIVGLRGGEGEVEGAQQVSRALVEDVASTFGVL